MPSESDLERHINKLVISRIIKTNVSFSEQHAEEFIDYAYNNHPYIVHTDGNNEKYWEGYTSKYKYSYNIKTKMVEGEKTQTKELDEGIDELYDKEVFISKIFKNTFVIKKDAMSSPKYIDTFILPDLNFICIIGGKDNIRIPDKTIKEYLNEENIEYEEINICNDFLLWILWKISSGETISPRISLDYFDDLRVGLDNPHKIGYEDSPASIKTEGSAHEIPSLPICYGLFNKKSLNQFKGGFNYNTIVLQLKIDIFKREEEISNIYIYSNHSLDGLKYSEKLQIVLPFLYHLSELICEWNNFDKEKKYPNEDYLNKLMENAQNEFDEMINSFEEYKKYISSKN